MYLFSSPSAAVVVVGEPSQVDPLVEVPVGEEKKRRKNSLGGEGGNMLEKG